MVEMDAHRAGFHVATANDGHGVDAQRRLGRVALVVIDATLPRLPFEVVLT